MNPDRTDGLEQMLRHAEWITRLSRALAGGGAEADDVAQDTWVAVLRAPLPSLANPRQWLQAIMRRRAAKLRRGEERRARREQAFAQQREPVPSNDELLHRLTMQRELTDAVLALDEPYRSTVALRFFEQLDVDAIAMRSGAPRNTVRSRLQRGLQLLRARLDQRGGRDRWMPAVLALGGRRLAIEAAAGGTAAGLALLSTMKKTTIVVAALAVALSVSVAFALLWEPPPTGVSGPAAANPDVAEVPANAAATKAAAGSEDAEAARLQRIAAVADGDADAARRRDAEPSGDLLVRVVWADETPAANVHVYVARRLPGLAGSPLAEVVSDDKGEARAHMPAGAVTVSCDRGARVDGDVAANQSSEVRLKLDAGVDVVGVVRDGNGAFVAGADIWLTSFQSAWCGGAVVATADASGHFTVRAANKDQSLGALAAGFAPSALVDLELVDTKSPPVRVELVMGEAGGALAGRVVDEKGKGVAGARVAVGSAARHGQFRAGTTTEDHWTPRRAVTGADGSYVVEGLAPGAQPVEVWASAFPLWRGDCTIVAKTTAALDMTLLRPVTVFGIVTGEDGKPLGGAIVRAFPIAIAETFLQGGQYDFDGTFHYACAVADAEGRYRLLRAEPGEIHLYAGPGGPRRHNDTVPWANEVLRGDPGTTVEWNAKIEAGLTIRGVVRYRDGEPMPNVFVNLIEPGVPRNRAVVNGKDGRFRFVRLQKKAYDLNVQLWSPPKDAPPVEAREVWPDTGELELTAAFDAPKKQKSGSVRGTIVDTAGRLDKPLSVILNTDKGSWYTQSHLEGNSFRFDGIDPGIVQVIALAGDDPVLYGPKVELHDAEQKDVGALVTEPGGRMLLQIVRGPGTEELQPWLFVTPVGGSHGRRIQIPRGTATVTIDNLCPGEHRLAAYEEGMASVHAACNVTTATPGTATIELRAAVAREVVVEYGASQKIKRLRVQDARGGEVIDYEGRYVTDRPFHIKLSFPLGRFTARVETEGGGVAEASFDMTSLDKDQPPVVLQAK